MIGGRRVIALLLLGGAGVRLWPLSTEQRPKQFLKLFGTRSLFQKTVARLAGTLVDELVVVTNAAYEQAVLDEVGELGVAPPRLVLEPVRRDSGPAIAAGVAAALDRIGPESICVALPADHLIPDDAGFARALAEGLELATQDLLVTFGIAPSFPSTEYGYIEQGGAIGAHNNAFMVRKFHEKPNLPTAEAYVATSSFLWNSGIFVLPAATFAAEAARHMPDLWSAAQRAAAAGRRDGARLMLDADAFSACRRISIDHALFEKSDRVAVVPAAFGWSDIGNWASVYDALDKDACGNVVLGGAKTLDTTGSLVIADNHPLAVSGVSDFVVVASPQGTFVAPRACATTVKQLMS